MRMTICHHLKHFLERPRGQSQFPRVQRSQEVKHLHRFYIQLLTQFYPEVFFKFIFSNRIARLQLQIGHRMKPVHSTKVRHGCEHVIGGRHYSLDYDAKKNQSNNKQNNQPSQNISNKQATCTLLKNLHYWRNQLCLHQQITVSKVVSLLQCQPTSDKILFNLQKIQVEGQDISPKDV